MKKIFMACAAALAMSIVSCSSSKCYTCTSSITTGVSVAICDNKVTFTGLPAGVTAPTISGTTNEALKTSLEAGGVYKCVAK